MVKFLIAPALLLMAVHTSLSVAAAWPSSDCVSLFCRGSRAIRNIVHNLSKSDQALVVVRGLEIVPTQDQWSDETARGDNATMKESILDEFSDYLRTHVLNVKFSDLLADESNHNSPLRDLEHNDADKVGRAGGADEARKKDKGNGIILAMALMFAKTMAMLGLGGVAALAMKALGVAMLALLMATMVGVKSLAKHGHESSHSVQYVAADGHHHARRRRSLGDLPLAHLLSPQVLAYRGWHKPE